MADQRMKEFLCMNKHIIGFIHWSRDGLPHLKLLRKAIDMQAERPDEVDILGTLDGRIPIRCSICDDVKVWEMSTDALVAFFMQLDDKTIFAFSQRLHELSAKVVDLDDPANAVSIATPIATPIALAGTSPKSKTDFGEEKLEK